MTKYSYGFHKRMPVSFLQWFKVALQESNQSGNFHNWSYFYQKNVKSTECKNFNATGGRYHQCSTYNFYARGAQKRKMTKLTWLSFFAHSGSTCVKAVNVDEIKPWSNFFLILSVVNPTDFNRNLFFPDRFRMNCLKMVSSWCFESGLPGSKIGRNLIQRKAKPTKLRKRSFYQEILTNSI